MSFHRETDLEQCVNVWNGNVWDNRLFTIDWHSIPFSLSLSLRFYSCPRNQVYTFVTYYDTLLEAVLANVPCLKPCSNEKYVKILSLTSIEQFKSWLSHILSLSLDFTIVYSVGRNEKVLTLYFHDFVIQNYDLILQNFSLLCNNTHILNPIILPTIKVFEGIAIKGTKGTKGAKATCISALVEIYS